MPKQPPTSIKKRKVTEKEFQKWDSNSKDAQFLDQLIDKGELSRGASAKQVLDDYPKVFGVYNPASIHGYLRRKRDHLRLGM